MENEKSLHNPITKESAMTQRLELSKSKKIQRNVIKPLCNAIKTKMVNYNKKQSLEI